MGVVQGAEGQGAVSPCTIGGMLARAAAGHRGQGIGSGYEQCVSGIWGGGACGAQG